MSVTNLVHMIGPNAIGKTTALERWGAKYSHLNCISCDTGGHGARLVDGSWIPTEGDWKGDKLGRQKLVGEVRSLPQVSVLESARTTTTTSFALATEQVIVVMTSGRLLGENLRLRCEAKSKQFKSSYWTSDKLEYEASRRYLNFARKSLRPGQYKIFNLINRQTDWQQVDEYFGSIYRKLHNVLVRQHQ